MPSKDDMIRTISSMLGNIDGVGSVRVVDMDGSGQFDRGPSISKEGQIARLEEMLTNYQRQNPFGIGELVTPRADSGLKGIGIPHIVLDLRDDIEPDWRQEHPLNRGCCDDFRIAYFNDDETIVVLWQESFRYEAYQR